MPQLHPTSAKRPTIILKPYSSPDSPLMRLRPWLAPALGVFCLFYGFFFALTAPYLIVPFSAPVALLGALAIWALPEFKRPPTGPMVGFMTAFIICLIAWPNYVAIALPGLPWLTLLRLTGIPMAVLLLVCVSVSPSFRGVLNESLHAMPYVWKLLVGFIAIQFFTIALSSDPTQSLQKFIVAQTNWTAVFVVSCFAFQRPGRIERYAVLLWILAVLICCLGVIEAHERRVLWAGHLPSFLKVGEDFEYLKPIFRRYTDVYRVKATFGTPLGLSEFLALTCPFFIQFMIGKYGFSIKAAAAVSLCFVVYTIDATDSRLGMAAIIVSGLVYTLLWAVVRWKRDKAGLIGFTVVAAYPAIFCGMVAATFLIGRLRNRVWGGGAEQGSSDAREEQIQRGLPMVLKNPIGHGAGQAADTLGFYSPGGFLTIDNYYLAIALEYGVLGFVLYYGMFLLTIWYAFRHLIASREAQGRDFAFLAPLAASLTSFVVIKAVFSQQDNHPLAFLMMGMVAALVYRLRAAQKAA